MSLFTLGAIVAFLSAFGLLRPLLEWLARSCATLLATIQDLFSSIPSQGKRGKNDSADSQ